jgi:DNA-binding SARP family transcriptional activator/tetratricopeptide (TPR) repeat protein
VLGPVEVAVADVSLDFGRLERTLLAVLAAHARRVVSADRLVTGLWGQRPPASARNRVQALVSSIRRTLGESGGLILTRPPGYLMAVDQERYDADRFEDLVRAGRAAAGQGKLADAVRDLGAALALWHGPAFDGVASDLVRVEATRLDELRWAAFAEWADARLATGDHERLIIELTGPVAAEPLREGLRGKLMLALYRCGRQADALRVYAEGAAVLAEEHGLDPSAELQRLRQAILVDDPALMNGRRAEVAARPAAAPVPAQLPMAVRGFTGRAALLDRLDGLLAGDGATAVVVSAMSGAAGVGKTALAVHWAQRVTHHFPDGQLYLNLRGFDPGGSAMSPAEAIRRLLDAFQVPPGRVPVSFDAQIGLYRSLLAGKRVLVVLDNARDAEHVRPLLPGAPGCLAVVTSRNQLTGLVAAEGAVPLALDLLSPAEARDLLANRLGADRVAAEPAAVDDIIESCARLPLALAIVAARAAVNATVPLTAVAGQLRRARLDGLDGGDPFTDVRAVLSWSYQVLDAESARLFRLLGLHPGPDIAAPAVASLAGRTAAQVRPLLAELAGAHLVTEHAPGRYTFHDLLRAYATELVHTADPDAERRAAAARMLDHYLHTAHAAALLLQPHREPIVPLAAGAAEPLADYAQAVGWLTAEQPVLLALVQRSDSHAWQLAWTLTTFLSRRGNWRDLAVSHRSALVAAQRRADRAGQAHAHRGIALASIELGHDDDAENHHHAALQLFTEVGAQTGQAQTHLDLALVRERQGRHADALEHAHQALELFRRAGNRFGQANALNAVGWHAAMLGEFEQTLVHCELALTTLRQMGDRFGQAATSDTLGYAHHHLGHHRQAVIHYQQALDLSRTLGDRYHEAVVLIHLGDLHRDAGAPAAAHAAWQGALETLEQLGHPDAEQVRAKLRQAART